MHFMRSYGKQELDDALAESVASLYESADRAIEIAERMIEESPESESAWFVLGALLKESIIPVGRRCDPDEIVKHPRYELLIESFDRLIELNPAEPAYRWNRAMIRQNLGLFGDAVEDLQSFIEVVEPRHAGSYEEYRSWLASAYDHLGCDLLGIGALEEAVAALKRSVELDPAYRCAWEDLSMAYEMLGDVEKSAKCLSKASGLDEPTDA